MYCLKPLAAGHSRDRRRKRSEACGLSRAVVLTIGQDSNLSGDVPQVLSLVQSESTVPQHCQLFLAKEKAVADCAVADALAL